MKIKTKLVLLACLGLATCAMVNKGNADSVTTDVSVNITSGGLVLDQPKSIDFGDVNINGQDQTIDDKSASKITVSDLRGVSDSGWRVTAKLQDKEFSGLAMSVLPKSDAGYVQTPTQRLLLSDQESEIAEVTADKISEENLKTDINLNTQLSVPQKITAGSRQNTIVWDIQDVPAS